MTIPRRKLRASWQISTHTPLARRDQFKCNKARNVRTISTHTPLARRDNSACICLCWWGNFYSHASCEAWLFGFNVKRLHCNFYSHASCEAWHIFSNASAFFSIFLLTRLLRGVTTPSLSIYGNYQPISTHTPLTRRDLHDISWKNILAISTHTPLTRRDVNLLLLHQVLDVISTHTPLTRRDPVLTPATVESPFDFYSHASYEAWRWKCSKPHTKIVFLLTRLLRGVTIQLNGLFNDFFISTHTPLTRRDNRVIANFPIATKFLLTRLLRGVTLLGSKASLDKVHFNSHASYEAWRSGLVLFW